MFLFRALLTVAAIASVTLAAPTPNEVLARAWTRFKSIDGDDNGAISLDEGKAYAKELTQGVIEQIVEDNFDRFDADKSGDLNLGEVRQLLVPEARLLRGAILRAALNRYGILSN